MARELPPVQQVSRTQGAVAKLSKEPSKQTGTQFDESKYVKLGDETYVDKDTFEKLPQDTKEAGKRSGLDALKKSLSTHQSNYDEIIKELKPFTSDSGINLAKALASGVTVERLKSEGIFSDDDINKALNFNKAVEKVKQVLHHGEMGGTTVTGYGPDGQPYSYTVPYKINVLDENGNVSSDFVVKYYAETGDKETIKALGYNVGEVARAARTDDDEEPKEKVSEPKPPTTTPKPDEPIQVVYDPVTGAPIIPPKMPEAPKEEEQPVEVKPGSGVTISTPVGPIVMVPPTLEQPIVKTVPVEKPISEPDVPIAGGWKPDFTKPNPYEGAPKEYLDYVAKTYVPTLEKPLPPTVGQLVDPETNTYINADNGLIQITDQKQVDGLNSSIEAKSERIYQEILDKDYEKLGDGTYYPKSEFNRLSEEFKQVAKSQGIDSVRQLMDERSQKFESYKTENEFNTNKLIEGLDSGNITEQDIVAYFGQDTYDNLISVRDTRVALREKIKADATAKGVDIVNTSDLSIDEIQSLIESGSDPKDLILAGYEFDKVNVAVDKINQEYVDAQNRLSGSVVSVQINPVTGQKREIQGEINFDSLAKYRRENPDDTETIEKLYGKETVDTIDAYNTKVEANKDYIDKQVSFKEGGGLVGGISETSAVSRAVQQLGLKPTNGSYLNTYRKLDDDTKYKVVEIYLQDPATRSLIGAIGADIDLDASKSLVTGLLLGGVQPITHVMGKQVTIDEARRILSENYKTEVNVAKDFVQKNGTVDVNAFKSKLETDEEFKKQVLDQTGDDNSDDLIERLEYYNNGMRVTGEELAIAGATGALDILSLGGAGALAGLGRFGKGAVVGINVASAGIFAPSAFRVIKDPKASLTEKIISGATPILLLVGGSVGLKGKPAKAIKPENVSKATLGVKEVPVNAMLEKATKDVSVAGITTRTIVNVKAIVPDTVKAVNNASYKVDLNLEKAFQRLDDVVTTIKDYKGNIAKIKEVSTGLGSDVRVKFDNAIYKIELNGERMAQSFDDLVALATDYKNLQAQFNNAISGRVKVGVATLESIRYRMELAGEKLAQKLDDITEGLTDYKGNWNALKSSLSEVGSEVRGKAEDILYKGELNIEQFSQKVDDIVSQVTDYKRNWTELKDNVKSVVKTANDVTMNALYKLDVNLEQTAQKVEDGISNLTNIKPYIAEIKDLVKNADIKVRNNVNEFTYQLDLNSEKIAQRLQDYTEALLDYNRNWNEFTTKVKDVASMTKADLDDLVYKLDVSGERVAQSFDDLVALVSDYKGNLEKLKSTLSEVKGGVEDSLYKAGLKIEEYAQKLDDLIEQVKTKRDLVHLDYLKKSAKNLKEDFNVELRIAELERTIKGKLADIKNRLDAGKIDELQAETEINALKQSPEWVEHTKIVRDLGNTFQYRLSEYYGYRINGLDSALESISRKLVLGDEVSRMSLPYDLKYYMYSGDDVSFNNKIEQLKLSTNELPLELRESTLSELDEIKKYGNDYIDDLKKSGNNPDIDNLSKQIEHEQNELDNAKKIRESSTSQDIKRKLDKHIPELQKSIERKKTLVAERLKDPFKDVEWFKIVTKEESEKAKVEKVTKELVTTEKISKGIPIPKEKVKPATPLYKPSEIGEEFVITREKEYEPYYALVFENGQFTYRQVMPTELQTGKVYKLSDMENDVFIKRVEELERSMTHDKAIEIASEELGNVKSQGEPEFFESVKPELETRPFEFTVPEPVTLTPPEPITVTPPEPIEKIVTEPKEEVKPKELPYTMFKEEYDLKKRVIPPVVKIELSEEEKQAIVNNPPSGALVIIQGRPTYRGGTNAPMFKVIVPPYDEAHMFSTRLLPKGYVDYGFKGKGSAFKSVQVLGNPPNDIENLDLGIVKINVRMVDGKPIVSYAQDEDSNSGQRSKTVGYGAGQIPVEEWQEAKAQGIKYSDFIESHGEQQPAETEQKLEVKTEPIIEEKVQPNNIVVEPKVEQELVEESETEIEDEYEPIIEEVEEDVIEEKPKQRESSGGWHSIDDLIGSEKDLQDLPPVNEQGVIVDESERFDSQVKEQDKKTIEDARNYLLNGLQKKLRYQFGHKKVYEVDPDYISKVMTKTYPELDEFQNSGNWKVYPNAIPLNEYWISNRLPKNNFKTSAIHEVVVADAMGQGRDKDKEYEDATVNVASVIDVYAMDNPNKLDRILAGALQGKYKSLLIEAKRGQEDLGSSEDISNEYREYGNISERGKRTKNWWDDKYYEQSDDTGLSYQNKYYRGRRLLPPSIGGNL